MERENPSPSLSSLLSEVGRRLRWSVLRGGLLTLIAAILGGIGVGTCARIAGAPERAAALLGLLVLTLGILATLLDVVFAWRRSAMSPLAVARWLDGLAASPGRARILDAEELRRDFGRAGESEALARAAIDAALEAAEGSGLADLARRVARRRISIRARLAYGLLGLNVAVGFWDPSAYRDVTTALTTAEGVAASLVAAPPEPRLDELKLSFRYPEHSGRPPRTVRSSTGRIEALAGTEVVIETRSREPVSGAILVLEDGPEVDANGWTEDEEARTRKIAVETAGRSLRARFVVSRGGRYRFELKTAAGERQVERRGHDIILELDAPPKVRLIEPEESPLEVNRTDRVKVVFEAEDDFLLGEARISWRVLGTTREGHTEPSRDSVGKRKLKGRLRFDLRKLDLQPGDRISYWVEVFDNDGVSGPKVGASEAKALHIYSKRTHHQRILEIEMKALDAVVNLLGDHLESPYSRTDVRKEALELLEQVHAMSAAAEATMDALDAAAVASAKDPLGPERIDAAFRQAKEEIQRRQGSIERARRRALAVVANPRSDDFSVLSDLSNGQERMVGTTERHSVYLSDLIDDQRMMDAEALAKELRDQQRALREALQAYKDEPTPETRAAIERAIQDIQSRIQEIMSELSKLRAEIPTDYVSQDALEDRSGELDELMRKVEEGDLDGAMRDLDEMLGQTERMLSQLQEGREELQTREYSEITERAEKLWQRLEQTKARQRDLANRTEKIANEVRERSKERLGDASDLVSDLVERLERAEKALEPVRPERHMPDAEPFEHIERRLADGKSAVKNQDFGAAKEVLEQMLDHVEQLERDVRRRADQAERFGDVFGMGEHAEKTRQALQDSKKPVEEVLEEIEKITPDPSRLLDDDERQQLKRYGKEQNELSEEAENIQRELEELGEQLPIVGPEVRQALDEARGAMSSSETQLGQGDAPGAVGEERRAAEALERLSKQLEEMGSQQGGGQGGAGVPLPFGQPKGSSSENQRGGQGQLNRDKVEIPKPEEFQAPTEFREDILEAAKESAPERYKEAVRRYYEELVK